MKDNTNREKLDLWKRRASDNATAYQDEFDKMDERERLYRGSNLIKKLIENQKIVETPHVRNICAELIEAQVDSAIPQPKVTAKRKEDEGKAKLIEDMLRAELDRLPFEMMNDMTERTRPIQGGTFNLVEWDNTKRSHTTVGDLDVKCIHPKQIIPQDGITSSIEDMDYIILRFPQSKSYIKRKYNVDVTEENEEDPEVRGLDESPDSTEIVTQYIAFYRNDNGSIGKYSWVGDTELEDLEDYQARRLERCTVCGAVKGPDEACACGNKKFIQQNEEYEEIYEPIFNSSNSEIPIVPGATQTEKAITDEKGDPILDEHGLPLTESVFEPTKVPYYKPDVYPVILFRNVSLFGSFLGDSDIDKIASHQNVINRIECKIIHKLIKAGSFAVLPDTAAISQDEEEMTIVRPGSVADADIISTKTMQAAISQDMAYLAQVYEEARQVIGITDSFQGRADRTATSGKAKQFAAAQSAGRLESKRVMKDASFAYLFEVMFKFKLAYCDEPRNVLSKDVKGETVYKQFNKWDFLERDAAGEYWWNTDFIFSCENTSPLAANREAMWQETRMNFESGTFGNPADIDTVIIFWRKMEDLHYPGAGETRALLEEKRAKLLEEAQRKAEEERKIGFMPLNTDMAAREGVV